MKKLESSFRNMFIVLSAIALIAAAGLAKMNATTLDAIEASANKKSEDAIKKVLPEDKVGKFDKTETVEAEGLKINKAYAADGSFIGAAVEGKADGFSGLVHVMVGFDKEGNILEYEVLTQSETPGLGTKMLTWFKPQVADTSLVERLFGFVVVPAKVNSSIIGLNPAKNNLTVSKSGGEIDAITASTISSRAFLKAIASAYNAYAAANKPTDAEIRTTKETAVEVATTQEELAVEPQNEDVVVKKDVKKEVKIESNKKEKRDSLKQKKEDILVIKKDDYVDSNTGASPPREGKENMIQ